MTSADGATCVITGGASGIGLAVAKETLAGGQFSHCAILDRERGRFDELGERGDSVIFVECDVRDPQAVEDSFQTLDSWGPATTGLVTCAGITHFVPTAESKPEDWERVLQVNLAGTLNSCVAASERMRSAGGGAIVTLSSVSAYFGWPRRAAYSVSKAGIVSLTRTLAVEWAEDGIRVNAVAPGYIRTEMVEKLIDSGSIDYDTYAALSPMGRFGWPPEIARPILFLLSPDAAFVTGATLPIDGGFVAAKVP